MDAVHRAALPGPRSRHPAEAVPVLDISVVIPAYNEEHRLLPGVDDVCRYLRAAGVRWEVIVVDDGSADATAAVAAAAAAEEPRIRLLRAPVNRGKGHAVRIGIAASRGRRVLFCDADAATPIGELALLHERLDQGYAAAIGSRARPGARIGTRQHPLRELLGKAGNRLIQAMAVPGIRDTQCGFKLFDGDKARTAFARARTDGWGFDVEILRIFHASGWPIAEVPVRWSHRPGSKVGPLDYAKVLAEVVRVRLQGAAPRVVDERGDGYGDGEQGADGPDAGPRDSDGHDAGRRDSESRTR
ncbi:dolichyl-phosphate beta-glucosyltransferase [Streptomyces sp. NPDC001922]|uniref:dolichyl-phosphate beta-glucosyltransferase n=1 Tax=Streptomyces sp. NPDC001922 TaxID=3364624 RepID=UPI0036A7B4CD